MHTPHILVTNDDGIFSDGLKTLVDELKKIATLTVVAPDCQRSAASHSVTFFKPVRLRRVTAAAENGVAVYSCDGTPTDCVVLGILDLLRDKKPDMVVSGINRGANMGYDLSYSGTVAAAIEGVIHGIPSIAVSLTSYERADFNFAAKIARKAAESVLKFGLPRNVLLNINVPDLPEDEIAGFEITRQGESIYDQRVEKRIDPRGREYFWIGGGFPTGHQIPGTDFVAVANKKVSVTPVSLQMTDDSFISELRKWELNF